MKLGQIVLYRCVPNKDIRYDQELILPAMITHIGVGDNVGKVRLTVFGITVFYPYAKDNSYWINLGREPGQWHYQD